MKNYLQKLVEAGILTIISEDLQEISYHVEDDYFLIIDGNYTFTGNSFIVESIRYNNSNNKTVFFDNDSFIDDISQNELTIAKILDI